MSDPIKKALLEAGRLLGIALVSAVIILGGAYIAEADLSAKWVEMWGIAIVLLRAVDKFLHELGKEKKSDTLTKGLIRF